MFIARRHSLCKYNKQNPFYPTLNHVRGSSLQNFSPNVNRDNYFNHFKLQRQTFTDKTNLNEKEIPKEIPKEDETVKTNTNEKVTSNEIPVIDKEKLAHDINYFSSVYVTEAYQKLRDEFRSAPFVKEWKEVMDEMDRRRYNTRRLRIIILLIVIGIILAFFDLITKWAGKQASVITTKTLDDEKFKTDLVKFGEEIANRLVNSPTVQADVTYLIEVAVKDLLRRDEIKDSVSGLILNTLKSNDFQKAGTKLTSNIANELISSPKYETLRENANNLLVTEVNKMAKDPDVHHHLSKLTAGTLSSFWSKYIWKPSTPNKPIPVDNMNEIPIRRTQSSEL